MATLGIFSFCSLCGFLLQTYAIYQASSSLKFPLTAGRDRDHPLWYFGLTDANSVINISAQKLALFLYSFMLTFPIFGDNRKHLYAVAAFASCAIEGYLLYWGFTPPQFTFVYVLLQAALITSIMVSIFTKEKPL